MKRKAETNLYTISGYISTVATEIRLPSFCQAMLTLDYEGNFIINNNRDDSIDIVEIKLRGIGFHANKKSNFFFIEWIGENHNLTNKKIPHFSSIEWIEWKQSKFFYY